MSAAPPPAAESLSTGGTIPGLDAVPAYSLRGSAEASPIPVLIAVPHAGRAYPDAVVERMRDPGYAAMRLEDRHVDRLAEAVAAATGAALIVAHAPRAMLDLNRAPDDVDWEMVEPKPARAPAAAPGRRAKSGLGLVPRRLPVLGELWRSRLASSELEARIAGIHTPYHRAVGEVLAAMHARWGAALLLDLHSMPPLSSRHGAAPPAEFVIGDRFGSSCEGALVAAAFAWFAGEVRHAAHNRPYAGGYALEHHGDPRRGLHALQLEVDRRCYLDAALQEPGAGLMPTAELLAGLVRRLANEVALLGSTAAARWPEAAE